MLCQIWIFKLVGRPFGSLMYKCSRRSLSQNLVRHHLEECVSKLFRRIRLKTIRNHMFQNHWANLSLPSRSEKYVSKPFGRRCLETIRKHTSPCSYLYLPQCTRTQIETEITDSNQTNIEQHLSFGALGIGACDS